MPLETAVLAQRDRGWFTVSEVIADKHLLAVAALDQKVVTLSVERRLEHPFGAGEIDGRSIMGIDHKDRGYVTEVIQRRRGRIDNEAALGTINHGPLPCKNGSTQLPENQMTGRSRQTPPRLVRSNMKHISK